MGLPTMHTSRILPGAVLLAALLTPPAEAQRGSRGTRLEALPAPQTNLYPAGMGLGARGWGPGRTTRPAILLTGYWPPSNEMIRRFSTDPVQNPDGWIGSDWEGRGYDVYSFFPEFPHGLGKGEGDLEVDYQDTSADFWPIADGLQPIAVITFSRGYTDRSWELEMNNRNLLTWIDDYLAPYQPIPAPPDGSLPADSERLTTLPVQKVMDAVNVAHIPGLNVYVDINGNGGGFLSEFIAYHGVWYQALHASPSDPAWCVAGGHVHVGGMLTTAHARQATHQTLRAVIRYVDEVTSPAGGNTEWFCVPNDTTQTFGAILTPMGSNSITRNDFGLQVVKTIPDNFGLAFYGESQQAGTPLGDGVLCVGAPLYRLLPAALADSGGRAHYWLDFTQPPLVGGPGQVTAGSTWQFQYWLRDPAGASQSNLSSGLSVTFVP